MLGHYEALTLNMTHTLIFTLEHVRPLPKFSEKCRHGELLLPCTQTRH